MAGAAVLRQRVTVGRYAGHEAGAYSGYAVCALLETLASDRTRDDGAARRLRHDALAVVRQLRAALPAPPGPAVAPGLRRGRADDDHDR